MNGKRAQAALMLVGLAMLCIFAWITLPGSFGGERIPGFLFKFFLACGLYCAALLLARRGGARSLAWVWIFAAAFRLVMLLAQPSLSDDVFRYIWDGRVQNAGISPYAYAVNSPALDFLNTPNRALVNYPWMASPYLPVAQWYSALLYALAPDQAIIFQAGAAVMDLLTGLFLMLALRRCGLPDSGLLFFLWNPLVIVESANNGHLDALMTVLIMGAVWLFVSQKQTASAVVLALATLVKPIPGLLALVWMARWGWKRTAIYGGVILGGIALYSGVGVIRFDGTGVLGATLIYISGWAWNSGLFDLLVSGIQAVSRVDFVLAQFAGRIISNALLLFALWVITRESYRYARNCLKAGREPDPLQVLRISLLPLAVYFLLTSTLHPWYLLPVLALLPLLAESQHQRLFAAAWTYFGMAQVLSYLAYIDRSAVAIPLWVRLVEYIAFFALLAVSAIRYQQSRRMLQTGIDAEGTISGQ